MLLDDDQLKIVNHEEGKILVISGAGSGKTHTITQRAIKRMKSGVSPDRILILTFTNKACNEIIERIKVADAGLPTIETFHGFGYNFIRNHPEEVGLRNFPSIMDAKDSKALLRELLLECGLTKDKLKQSIQILNLLSCEGFIPGNSADKLKMQKFFLQHEPSISLMNKALEAYIFFGDVKKQDNVIDYSDLINLPIKALCSNHLLKMQIREKYQDITVDESQDTNHAQFKMLNLISNHTICLVGDQNQSLYRWLGAQPENLDQFKKEHNPKVFYLQRNYRSNKTIVDSATTLISNNPNQPPEKPYSARDDSDNKILFTSHDRETEMAEELALQISYDLKNDLLAQNIAILYRVNRIGKSLEPALIRHQIPYYIKRGTELLERSEVKMLIAIGRLVVNSSDVQALTRFSTLIPGLGAKGVLKLAKCSRASKKGLWDNLDELTGKTKATMIIMRDSITELKKAGPAYLFNWALNETIFKIWLETEALKTAKNTTPDDFKVVAQSILEARIANLTVLKTSIDARLEDADQLDIEEQWASIVMSLIPKPPDEAGESSVVTLSTIHSSKGLQWEKVHIAGFSDGLMPLKNSETGEVDNLIEERCLAYVAMTRAQDYLHLHHVGSAVVHGQIHNFTQSRFLHEFGTDKNIEVISPNVKRI